MNHPTRRKFLVTTTSTIAVGTQILTGCGGGSAAAAADTDVLSSVADNVDVSIAASRKVAAPDPAVPPAVQAPPTGSLGVSTGAMQLTLLASVVSPAAPFCVGHAFRQGDVPAGNTLRIDAGTLQVTPKNTWSDGSLKFAVLAGQMALPAGTAVVVPLRKVASSAIGAPLSTASLKASGVTAQIGCGAFGTVAWAAADWDAPFMPWVSGPVMSSWIYRKPVGQDPHLVAWLEVRLFVTGAVEVLPWIENGYIRVPGPTNKNTTYTFTLGGTQRFSAAIDLKNHQRTPLIAGAALSYWLGADPGVTVKHDGLYVQSTELVPSYSARVGEGTDAVRTLVAAYQPLQAGNFNYDSDYMPGSGYQDPIGLLPRHDVLYLVSDVAQTYAAVVRNGFSAGRYPIHYRDEGTLRPLRIGQYPTLVIGDKQAFGASGGSTTGSYTPATTGGNGPVWDVAHSPSVGYLAYLVSGRYYFMEEVQFAATANYLGNGDLPVLRDGAKGLVQTCVDCWQTRSCAWDWRARVQALCVTPDDDTALRAEFVATVEANIEHFYGRYVAQPNNPQGWVMPGENYSGSLRFGATWQQDFVTAAFGFSLGLGLPVSLSSATKLAAFFQWKAKSVVNRLGPHGAFWYVNADPYTMSISPAERPDYERGTGPWYTSDADVYAATFAAAPAWLGATEGVLAGEYMPGERAYWGNLMPAISYAVRFGVPGAGAAYGRILAANNYSALSDAFDVNPVWAVRPSKNLASAPVSSQSLPPWLAGKPANTWIEIPNTAGAGGSAIDAYSGVAFKPSTAEIISAACGGHNDSYDNRVVSVSLLADSPRWTQRIAPSAVTNDITNANGRRYYADGKPAARHVYAYTHYVAATDRVVMCGARYVGSRVYDSQQTDAVNCASWTWDAEGMNGDVPGSGNSGGFGVAVDNAGRIYTSGGKLWNDASRTWSTHALRLGRYPVALDSLRNRLVCVQWGDGGGSGTGITALSADVASSVTTAITLTGSGVQQFSAEAPVFAAMDYDAANDRFLFYSGQPGAAGRVYVIKPNGTAVWDLSILALAGSITPPAEAESGLQNRFFYVAALQGFVLLPSASSNLFFIRLA